jgi:hypothetical protein
MNHPLDVLDKISEEPQLLHYPISVQQPREISDVQACWMYSSQDGEDCPLHIESLTQPTTTRVYLMTACDGPVTCLIAFTISHLPYPQAKHNSLQVRAPAPIKFYTANTFSLVCRSTNQTHPNTG